MSWLNDTFTDTTGTPITSHTSDSGATWAVAYQSSASTPQIFSTLGGVVAPKNALNILKASPTPPSADYQVAVTFYYDSINFLSMGAMARLSSTGNAGYLAAYTAPDRKWGIYRTGVNGATTLIQQSSAITYSSGNTPSIVFTVSGTGATVTLDLVVDGSNIISNVTDTSGSRITTAGFAGAWLNSNLNDQGMFINSIVANDLVSSSATITGPANGKISPLNSGTTGTSTFELTGSYTGTAPNQWRLVDDGGSTSIPGFDWTAFSVAPSAGLFSQTISGVPKKNGWYNIQVRDSAIPDTITTSGKVGAGVLVGVDGQSNAYLWFSATGDSTLTPDPLLRVTGVQLSNSWTLANPATMNAAISCGNALVSALGCPVGLVDGSWDGSGLTVNANGGQWVPTSTSGQAYQRSLAAINAAGGKLIGNIWIQGESDAASSVSQSTYYTALGTLISQRRTDLSQAGLPYIMVTLARDTTGLRTDAQRESIKLAQVQKCADSNVYRVDRMDLPLGSDGIHHTATGFTILGRRCAQAILAANGIVAQYRGPSYTAVQQISSTVYDVILTHHSGTDFTPTTAIAGFRVTDSGAGGAVMTISSVVRQAADKIRITLSSSPVGTPNFAYYYGTNPTISNSVLDNSSLNLPLEYNSGLDAVSWSISLASTSALVSAITTGVSFATSITSLSTVTVSLTTSSVVVYNTLPNSYNYLDRIKDSTTTVGTGTLTLSGIAPEGYRAFTTYTAGTKRIPYCIEDTSSGSWEIGLGTLVTTTSFSRDSVFASSNSNTLVSFGSGTKTIFVTLPATPISKFSTKDYIDLRDYAADPTFTVDSTAAIQQAILDAYNQDIPVIKIPAGRYKIAGPLSVSNAQLYIPNTSYSASKQKSIRFVGACVPNLEAQGLIAIDPTTNGVIFESTIIGTSGSSLLRGEAPAAGDGAPWNWNNTNVGFENMCFRTKADTQANPMTALNLDYFSQIIALDNLRIDTNKALLGSFDPSAVNSYGIKMPPVNNHAQFNGGTLLITGFTNGISLEEHACFKSLIVLGCTNAVVLSDGNHGSYIGHLLVECCKNSIKTNGKHPMFIGCYSSEHNTDGNWFDFTSDILLGGSPGTRKVVMGQATIVKSHVGVDDTAWTTNATSANYKIIAGAGAN